MALFMLSFSSVDENTPKRLRIALL